MSYDAAPARVRLSTAAHGPTGVQVRRRRAVAWVVLTAVAVAGLVGLVALRSAGSVPVPSATGVVQVQLGESLSEVAQRVAPGAPTGRVVARIVELNGLPGAAVRSGDSLVVPLG